MNERLTWHGEDVEKVIKLLASSKTTEEVEEIFDNVLTPREINDIARRYKALILLRLGRSYSDVKQETKLSNTTIARISGKIGFGFRDANNTKKSDKKDWKPPRKNIRYKGFSI